MILIKVAMCVGRQHKWRREEGDWKRGGRDAGKWNHWQQRIMSKMSNSRMVCLDGNGLSNEPVFPQLPVSLTTNNTAKNLKLTWVEHACSQHTHKNRCVSWVLRWNSQQTGVCGFAFLCSKKKRRQWPHHTLDACSCWSCYFHFSVHAYHFKRNIVRT